MSVVPNAAAGASSDAKAAAPLSPSTNSGFIIAEGEDSLSSPSSASAPNHLTTQFSKQNLNLTDAELEARVVEVEPFLSPLDVLIDLYLQLNARIRDVGPPEYFFEPAAVLIYILLAFLTGFLLGGVSLFGSSRK